MRTLKYELPERHHARFGEAVPDAGRHDGPARDQLLRRWSTLRHLARDSGTPLSPNLELLLWLPPRFPDVIKLTISMKREPAGLASLTAA